MNNDFSRSIMINYGILIFAGGIVAVLAILCIIYYFLYKRRINKALADGTAPKRSIFSPGGAALGTGIIIWFASTVFMVCQLQSLNYITTKTSSELYAADKYIKEQVLNAQYMIDTAQHEITGQHITESYSLTAGEYHADTRTVDAEICIQTDIVLGSGDKLTFRIGDNTTVLKKNADINYTGKISISIFDSFPKGILTLETPQGNIQQLLSVKIDTNDNPESSDPESWTEIYPSAEIRLVQPKAHENQDGSVQIDTDVAVNIENAEKAPDCSFTEMTVIFEGEGGKLMSKTDLLKNSEAVGRSDDTYTCHFSGTVPKGRTIYYLSAKDSDGNSYCLYGKDCVIYNSSLAPGQRLTPPQNRNDADYLFSVLYDEKGNILKTF